MSLQYLETPMGKELEFFIELAKSSENLQQSFAFLLGRNLPDVLLGFDNKEGEPIIDEVISRMHRSVGKSTPIKELDLLNELIVNKNAGHKLVDYIRETLGDEVDLLMSILKHTSDDSQLQAFKLLRFAINHPTHAQEVDSLIDIIQNSDEPTQIAAIKSLSWGGRYLQPDESALESSVELTIRMFRDTELSGKLRDQCLIFIQGIDQLGANKISLSKIQELIDLGNRLLTETVYSKYPQQLPGAYHEMALELFSTSIHEFGKTPSGFAEYISKYHSEAEVQRMLATVLKIDSAESYVYHRHYNLIADRFGDSSESILDKFPLPEWSSQEINPAFYL
jgi:hypothetical protein